MQGFMLRKQTSMQVFMLKKQAISFVSLKNINFSEKYEQSMIPQESCSKFHPVFTNIFGLFS